MSGERFATEAINSLGEYYLYLKAVYIYEWCRSLVGTSGLCLDLGCGDGYGAKIISGSAKKTIGLDIGKTAIGSANKKYADDKCSFQVYDGVNLPFADEACDAVICLQVIEHVDDPQKFLSEIFRVLKKQGALILATPNRLLRLDPGMKPWNIYHLREYSPEELKDVLKSFFKTVEMFGVQVSGKAKEVEESRIRKNKYIAGLDFLNLRRILPKNILSSFIPVLHKASGSDKKGGGKTFDLNIDPNTYYRIRADNFEDSFDILTVCRK